MKVAISNLLQSISWGLIRFSWKIQSGAFELRKVAFTFYDPRVNDTLKK